MYFILKKKLFFILSIPLIHACEDSKKNTDTSPGVQPNTQSFAEIAPIIKNSCGLAGCHGTSGAKLIILENNETNVKASKANIKDRLSRAKSDPQYMPLSPGILNETDKAKLLNYLK